MTDTQLDALDPQGRSVTFHGQTVTVKPLTLGQLPAFARAIAPITADIDILELAEGATDAAALSAIIGMIGTHGDALYEALGIATPLAADDFRNSRDLAGLANVATAVLRENVDFFGPQVEPIMAAVRSVLGQAAHPETDGSTASTPSSAQGTDATT